MAARCESAAQPVLNQRNRETQPFGTLRNYPLGLGDQARAASVDGLNDLLADTMALRDLYKKHHWQVSGPTFYSLHLLFDKHAAEQAELVDALAERIQTLGGICIACAQDVAVLTKIEQPPRGREDSPTQISRLLKGHEHVLTCARTLARKAAELGDDDTDDLVVSQVVRTNETQVWFLSEHPLTAAPRAGTSEAVPRDVRILVFVAAALLVCAAMGFAEARQDPAQITRQEAPRRD
jgi:starvation-inducible DNA-binding protein